MTTTVYDLAASADDAQEAGGTSTISGVSIAITATTRYGGWSFDTTAAPIAQAAPIALAIWEYTVVGTGNPNLTVKGHKVTNSAQFTTGASNVSNRYTGAPTTASVADSGSGISGGTRRAVDVTTIIQELVNQGGWTSTSRLTLIAKGETGTDITMRAWDFGSVWATLTITTGGGAMPKVARVRLGTKVGGLLCSI